MRHPRRGDAGVTLIEVLVSLAIFAVIGLAGLAVLETVARIGERTDGRLDRLAEIDRAFLVIRRDLAQMTGANTRLESNSLSFRRLDASTSFRVRYRLDGSALIREVWTNGAAPIAQQVLPGVTKNRWRVLNAASEWAEKWPPDGSATARPKAAEVTLIVVRDGQALPQAITRLFVLPAGQTR